jgi:hypothetical protein
MKGCIYDGDREARTYLDIWSCSDEQCRLEHDLCPHNICIWESYW